MRTFTSRRTPTNSDQTVPYEQVRGKLDSALTSVFSEDGKKAVLFYLTEKYSLTLEKASKNPKKLEDSLTNLLGEIGWTVVKRRILQEFYGSNPKASSTSVETTSLGDAFGSVRSFYSSPGTGFA